MIYRLQNYNIYRRKNYIKEIKKMSWNLYSINHILLGVI
jgi:hypothetical protein